MRRPTRPPARNLILVVLGPIAWFMASSFALSHLPAVPAPEPYRLDVGRQAEFPVEYWIDSRFSPEESAAIRAAFSTWGQIDSPVLFAYRGTSEATGPVGDGRTTVIRSTTPRRTNDPIAVVVTRLSSRRGSAPGTRLYGDTDIIIDFSGRVRWSTDGAQGKQDLQAVVTHEIGHVLGLQNVEDPDQLMYGYSLPVDRDLNHPARRELGEGDRLGLEAAYPRRTDETAN